MTRITDAMVVFALFSITGTLKAVIAAILLRQTDPISTIIATQRKRYLALWLGAVLSVGSTIWLYCLGSLSQLQRGAQDWIDLGGPFGWVVGINAYLLIYSVWTAIVVAAVVYVYRRPAALAFKVLGRFLGRRNVYITTASKRQGHGHWMPVQPQMLAASDGSLRRVFVEVCADSDGSHPVYADGTGRLIGSVVC